MKYCSGICVNGFPCLNTTTDNFCRVHKRDYEECGICYEPMVEVHTFECNHSVCKPCMARITKSTSLQNPVTRCPFCRNPCFFNVEEFLITILTIHTIINRMHDNEYENAQELNEMLKYIFQNTWILSSMPNIEEFLLDYFGNHISLIEQKYFKLMRRVFV